MNLRFLQRLGTPLPEAVAAGAVDDASETIVQAALFLLVLPFVHVNLHTSQFHAGPNSRLVLALVAGLAVGLALVLAIPKLRAKVVPPLRQALAGLWTVARNRGKRLELFGGNIGSELLYAISLGATCLAFGVHLNIGELVFVNTAASVSIESDSRSGRDRRRRGEPLGGPYRLGRRPVHGVRDRDHPASVHLLPAADLGLLLAAVAHAQGLRVTARAALATRCDEA